MSGLETGNIDAVVIGIGINCTTVFGGELAQKAGSLCVGAIRNRLAAELINQLNRIEDTIKDEFIGEYRERSLVIGKNVTIPTEPGSIYYAEDIGDSGELILIDEDKNKRILNTGEVSIRPLKGESIL